MKDFAAEFARRNAAKAEREAALPVAVVKVCRGCGKPVASPLCIDGTSGHGPYCFDCWVAA